MLFPSLLLFDVIAFFVQNFWCACSSYNHQVCISMYVDSFDEHSILYINFLSNFKSATILKKSTSQRIGATPKQLLYQLCFVAHATV
jgi:hypothetical protein